MSYEPYTHQQHGQRCHEAGKHDIVLSGQLVQVRKHGVMYCARIANSWTVPNGPDCWTVESMSPEIARFTVPVRQVVLCGDADCVCTPAAEGVDRAKLAPHEAPAAGAETGIRG